MTREEYIDAHVVHCKRAKYDVYCGRPSKYGNMFTHIRDKKTLAKYIVKDREEAISKYEQNFPLSNRDLEELKDKVLACWCHPLPCHCDIIAGKIWDKYYNES